MEAALTAGGGAQLEKVLADVTALVSNFFSCWGFFCSVVVVEEST